MGSYPHPKVKAKERTRPACRRRRRAVGFILHDCPGILVGKIGGLKVCGVTPQTTRPRRVLPI